MSSEVETELLPCRFCGQDRVLLLVEQEEWNIARVACRAHRCGALGPWVELVDYPSVADAKAEAARLWNQRALSQPAADGRGAREFRAALAKVKAIAALSDYPDSHTFRGACLLGDEFTLTFGDLRAIEVALSTGLETGKVRELIDKIDRQADCLDRHAEASGFTLKPVPSVFHLQSDHFRDIADELRQALSTLQGNKGDI